MIAGKETVCWFGEIVIVSPETLNMSLNNLRVSNQTLRRLRKTASISNKPLNTLGNPLGRYNDGIER